MSEEFGVGKLPKMIGYVRSGKIPEQANTEDKERQIRLIDQHSTGYYSLVDIIVEEGFDEGIKASRPGLRRALDLAADGTAKGIVVCDLGRLARDPRDFWSLYRGWFGGHDPALILCSLEEQINTESFNETIVDLLDQFASLGQAERRDLMQRPDGVEGPPLRAMKYMSSEVAETYCPFTDVSEPKVILVLDNNGGRPDDIVSICLSPADAMELHDDLGLCGEILAEGFIPLEDEKLKPEGEIFRSESQEASNTDEG